MRRRNERLKCANCAHEFAWQEWRRQAMQYFTGNPGAAARFLRDWSDTDSPQRQMMHIDLLIQSLHGRGALAPVFIQGTQDDIRTLLDELAA